MHPVLAAFWVKKNKRTLLTITYPENGTGGVLRQQVLGQGNHLWAGPTLEREKLDQHRRAGSDELPECL